MIAEQTHIKSGYKRTPVGIIPEEWEVEKLGELISFFKGSGLSKQDIIKNGKNKCIHYGELFTMYDSIISNVLSSTNIVKGVLSKKGDILMPASDVTPEGLAKATVLLIDNIILGGDINILRPIREFNSKYLSYIVNFQKKQIIKLVTGSTVRHIYGKDIKTVKIIFPKSLPEQQKIASILSTWDEAISNTKTLIEETKKRNKALAQQLLTGNTRLKGFEMKWTFEKISSVTDRIKNSFIPEKETFYQQIGIRSHGKGIFYKELVTGESLGNKSVFWIEPNCFIVNIVFAWEQAVAKTTENEVGMIASHRFPMFRPKSGILYLDYLLYFFKSPKGKDLLSLASPGGAGRNKTLGQSDFLKLQIPVPEFNEQKAISKVLETANQELKTLEQKLKSLEAQKKGLMQKLLTGEIRVKI